LVPTSIVRDLTLDLVTQEVTLPLLNVRQVGGKEHPEVTLAAFHQESSTEEDPAEKVETRGVQATRTEKVVVALVVTPVTGVTLKG
jgi:hypothetical protein